MTTLRDSARIRASSAIFTPAVVNSQIFMDAVANKLQNQSVEQKSLQTDIEIELPFIEKKDIDERYEFRDLLGEGATSEVYAAYDRKYKEEVAIKIVDMEKMRLNHSLLREIKIMKQLDHPNIIKLKNVCRTHEHLYIIMELAEGQALFDVLVEKKTYTEADARALVKDILSAIAYLHSKDIAHRDIKPENILCSSNGTIKLVDFGFASNSEEGLVTPLGTLGYKAPELIKKEHHSMSVDMWSLGVLTYILLCGFPPFFSCQAYRDDTDFLFNTPFWYFFNRETPDLENAILSGNHDFPEAFWKNVSSEAKSFVNGLLQIEAAKRMTAAEALQHQWITAVKALSPKSAVPLTAGSNNKAVTEILRATSYASLARRSLNIQGLLGADSPRGISTSSQYPNIHHRPQSVPAHLAGRLTQSADSLSECIDTDEETDSPPAFEEETLGTPIRSGWIEIKGLSVFTKRWVAVYNGVLCYYKSDKDDPSDFFGVINLAGVKVYHKDHQLIEIVHPQKRPIFSSKAPGSKKRLPAVVLHHRQSGAVLKVPVEEELNWLSDLQKAVEAVRQQTSLSSPFLKIENELGKEKEKSTTPSKRERRNTEREKEKEKEREKEREKEEKKEEKKQSKEERKKEMKRSASMINSVKHGHIEYWTTSKWKVRRLVLSREKLVIQSGSTDQDSSSRRKSLKQLEIMTHDITGVRSELSKDSNQTWLQKGVKSPDFPSDQIIFVVIEKSKNYHYFRMEDERAICDWLLALDALRELTPSAKFSLEPEEKNTCLERFYAATHKGGLIQNMRNNDYWLYDAAKSALSLFSTDSCSNWHCVWNGRMLLPSINAPSYIGAGYWDGTIIEWKERPDKNARVLQRLVWHAHEQEFRGNDVVWRWRDNQLFSDFQKPNWAVIGDVPAVLVMLLQLQESQ